QLPEFYRFRGPFGLFESDPKKIPSRYDPAPPDPSADGYRNAVGHFRRSVDVSPVRRSNLVDLTFDSHDHRLAALVVNRLADDYIKQNIQVKWDETEKASEWLQGKLVDLKAKLEKAEDAMQAYAQAKGIVFISEKENMVNARLEQLLQQYTKAQSERYGKEAFYSL